MRRYAVAALVMVAVAVGWVEVLPSAPRRQPIAFPHAKHQTIDCTVCHRGAATEVRAGIPGVAFCGKCHATPPAGTAQVWQAALDGRPIPWVQITHVPEHVMFSHRRHVALGRLDCASCHGEIRSRETPVAAPAFRIEMKTCLGCHSREGAAEDCAACHR